jgi:broad specificity phosphatase PhoE
MTTVYLIRHGETTNNLEQRCNGCRTDQPLSARGEKQAAALATYFDEHPVDTLHTSYLIRAKQTAAIAFRTDFNALNVEPDLHEVDLGEWDGTPYAEAAARYPELWAGVTENSVITHFPGGESVTEAADRIFAAFLRIARAHRGERIAIIAHEMILVLLLLRVFRQSLTDRRFMGGISNTGFDLLEIDEQGHATMKYWNYTDHLDATLWNEADYATDWERLTAEFTSGTDLPL